MTDTGRFLTALGRVIRAVTGTRRRTPSTADAAGGVSVSTDLLSPGQAGPSATIEVDARRLRSVRLAYTPSRDGDPDPGEIVWTWVPYEENDGRGKDRPVAIVAASGRGEFLAVQLTSKGDDRDPDHVPLGVGPWDSAGRPSWARTDRIFRVRAEGMRREAASLDAARYATLTRALSARYGWR